MPLKKIMPLAALCLCCLPGAGLAGTVTAGVKASVDRVLAIMQSPAYAAPDKKPERDRLVHAAVADKFSWEEMSMRALAPHWQKLTPAQQAEFVTVFNTFLERTYISKIDLFLQEEKNFSPKAITYTAETIKGRYALVESKIVLQEEEVPLSYKLINKNGAWVVYDMSIDGVGLVTNYRTQFDALLAGDTFGRLIEKLKARQGETIVDQGPPASGT